MPLVYNPTAPSYHAPQGNRFKVPALAGKTIGFIDNAKPNFNHLVDDLAAILAHAVLDRRYSGIFNATALYPVKNKEFTERLASSIRRPANKYLPMNWRM